MSDILPSSSLLSAFIGIAIVLAVTPGPGVMYIVTRSATEGRAAGLASVLGVAIGNAISAAAAAFGLGAIISVSQDLFTALRIAGALYLFYLAARALGASRAATDSTPMADTRPSRYVLDGVFVATLNPKTALFYAALIPQFMDAPLLAREQALILSAIFVCIAAVSDCLYALLAGASAGVIVRRIVGKSAFRYVAAMVYATLGILALATQYKPDGGAKSP